MTMHAVEPVVRSPFSAPDVPTGGLSDLVLRQSPRLGERPALIDAPSGRTITYGQLAPLVRRTAAGLAARGFGQGDVLAIFSPNLPEYAVAAHAALSLGGIVTTANPLYTAEELARQLEDSGARTLVTVPPFVETARAAGCEDVIVFGEAEGAAPFASLLDHGDDPPHVRIKTDDTAVIPYSSGTTGLPKGVELTHGACAANVLQGSQLIGFSESDTIAAVAPFFHALGFTVLMNSALAFGSTIVSLPRFELEGFLSVIQDYRVTGTVVVPPIALALARHPAVDNYDLSSLRFVGCGAAPLGVELQQEAEDRLGCPVAQGYGMTEATAGIAISSMREQERNDPEQVGILLPGTEARVVDAESGTDLGTGGTGEIWIRGPQLMRGYLNNPGATAATIDEDGWLHTGRHRAGGRRGPDVHHRPHQGADQVQGLPGRTRRAGGAAARTHPAVAAAAVVGAPDEEAGEIPTAFIVTRGEVADDELMAWVAERVAPHKRVRRVERVDAIPASPTGKILRRELRVRL